MSMAAPLERSSHTSSSKVRRGVLEGRRRRRSNPVRKRRKRGREGSQLSGAAIGGREGGGRKRGGGPLGVATAPGLHRNSGARSICTTKKMPPIQKLLFFPVRGKGLFLYFEDRNYQAESRIFFPVQTLPGSF